MSEVLTSGTFDVDRGMESTIPSATEDHKNECTQHIKCHEFSWIDKAGVRENQSPGLGGNLETILRRNKACQHFSEEAV